MERTPKGDILLMEQQNPDPTPDIKLLYSTQGYTLSTEDYFSDSTTKILVGQPLVLTLLAENFSQNEIRLLVYHTEKCHEGEVVAMGKGFFQLVFRPPDFGLYQFEINVKGERVGKLHLFEYKKYSGNEPENPEPAPKSARTSHGHEEIDPDLINYFKTLFIQLETTEDRKSYKLELRQKKWNRCMKEASSEKDSMPFVIGLIGDALVGKSSIVLPLIDHFTSGEELLKIIFQNQKDTIKESFNGNSANIHLYKSERIEERKLFVFDTEGTSANGIPTLLQKAILYLSQNASGMYREGLQYLLKDPVKRNQASQQLLPTLMYLICDLIIFISTDTFHNTSFMQKAIQFVQCIKAPPRGGIRPQLLLISNKLTLSDGIWNIKLCTEKFLDLETSNNTGNSIKAKEILDLWYDNVVCVCLPNWNEAVLMKTSDPLNPRADPVGCKRFVKQMLELKAIIDDQVKHRLSLRKEKGFHISEKTYLELIKLLIDEMPSSGVAFEHMKGILDYYYEIIQHVTDDVKRVNLIFQHLLLTITNPEASVSQTYQEFRNSSVFAMKFLACQIALKVRVVFCGPQRVTVQEKWKEQAREMIELIDEQRFCYAVFNHRESQSASQIAKEFRCLVPKMQHIHKHFTGPLFEPHTDWNVVKKFFYEMRKFFGFPYYPRWDGAFVPNDEEKEMYEDLMDVFEEAIKVSFEQETKPALLRHTTSILKNATNGNLFSIYDMVEHEPGSGTHREDICLACLCMIGVNEKLCSDCFTIWPEA